MIKEIGKSQYMQFWKEHNGSCLQSWQWGEVKSATWNVFRYGVFEDEEIVCVVSVLVKPFPYSGVTKLFGLHNFAYIPRGFPIRDVKYFKLALDAVLAVMQKQGVAFILIDPENNFLIKGWNEQFKAALEAGSWKPAAVSIEPNQTDVVDIAKSEEEMLTAMKPKWRRNIKKATRDGVKVNEVTGHENIEKFYKPIASVEQYTSFKARDVEYFKKIWDEMSEDQLVRVFVAEYENEVVASYMVLTNDKVAFEIYGGATRKGRDVEASYLLKWEIMKKMSEEGRKYYDHWGVAPKDDADHPLVGISYFKSGFGGKYVEFLPQYVKVFNKIGYWLYRLRS